MPFKFSAICELLSQLEELKTRDPPLLSSRLGDENRRVVEYWVRAHRRQLDAPDADGVAVLSTLFPERRTDRVYGMQESRLSRVISRSLGLNNKRFQLLQRYKVPGNGDLGACAQRILEIFDCEQKPGSFVTIEEVDHALHSLAARCKFSSPEVRLASTPLDAVEILGGIFRRLKSTEAKWFTRLIMKDYSPVVLDMSHILRHIHFLLPGLLRFHKSFAEAIRLLRGPLQRYPPNPDPESAKVFKQDAAKLLRPQVGVKVGTPMFYKARSFDHCLKMTGDRLWTVERKYDGEYSEIHIDLNKGRDWIQIFSKSGKDSTQDRVGIHNTIHQALRIGEPSCMVKRCCIVLGELLVYSDNQQTPLEFHEIRKHVKRSGRFLGTDKDSRPSPDEHLMLVFFDVLLVDDCIVMAKPHEERREILSRLVKKRPGHAITTERRTIDFSRDDAKSILTRDFAVALAARAEGLVLKPADLPYFSFDAEDESPRAFFIKLKKDYMQDLGGEHDVADFAVIGASYDAKLASRFTVPNLRFTSFHLGCIKNPEALRFGHKPTFEPVAVLTAEHCIPAKELQALNSYGQYGSEPFQRKTIHRAESEAFDIDLDYSESSKIGFIFNEPCVVEVLGSGFEKPSNKYYFMLRHPRILKLHLDRSWKDTVTIEGLQSMADVARNTPPYGESQEVARLVDKLVKKAERNLERERQRMTTPRTEATTVSPGSEPQYSPEQMSKDRRRSGRRRSSGQTSPTPLVRIDTVELLQNNRDTEQMTTTAVLQARPGGTNSLQTPPLSSPDDGLPSKPKLDKRVPDDQQMTDAAESISRKRKRVDTDAVENPDRLHKRMCIRPSLGSANAELATMADNAQTSPDDHQEELKKRRLHGHLLYNHHAFRPERRLLPPESGRCAYRSSETSGACLFTQAVVYLSPCVAQQAWVRQDLLTNHGAIDITSDLEKWARQTHLSASQGYDTVAESQAFPDCVKIAIVERNRRAASEEAVAHAVRLEIRELILWLDWRFLEQLKMYEEIPLPLPTIALRRLLPPHVFGLTEWDDEQEKVVFRPAREPRPRRRLSVVLEELYNRCSGSSKAAETKELKP